MYSVGQAEQLSIFISSLGFGVLLGILYDIFRVIRLSLTKSKIAIVIFDLLYFFCFGLFSFLFILALNKGEIRFYIIAGEIIGAFFYYISFGVVAIRFTDFLIDRLKRLYLFIFKAISAPFRLIKKLFSCLLTKIKKLFLKTEKNSEKMRKKHLPKLRMYVYNLFGIFLTSCNSLKKGGAGSGKEKSQEKA